MSKTRLGTIRKFRPAAHHDGSVFFNALIACLSPAEKCEALASALFQEYGKRAALVRRIIADMAREVQPCHRQLVRELTARLEACSGKERVTCASILLEIAENIAGADLESLLDALASSPNGNIRKQVYRRFKARPHLGCPSAVVESWVKHGDFEAARLIIDRATVAQLSALFGALEQAVARQGWLLARLYLRFADNAPASLARLEKIDPITHAYVATKLGRTVAPERLVELYRNLMFDQRGGLIVWCAGQMGHWTAVRKMQALRDRPPEDIKAGYFRSLGINPAAPGLQLPSSLADVSA